ncbi:MAG: AAA family ATPase [Saprospiraceae bacterium]
MKIKKIKFENFRLFENLEVNFPDSNFIVLIGNNGAGKTSILEGIAICLNSFVEKLFNINSKIGFGKSSVSVGKENGFVILTIDDNGTKTEINVKSLNQGIKNEINEINPRYKETPLKVSLLIYYQVGRTTNLSVISKGRKTVNRSASNCYENAFSNNFAGLETFENWFNSELRNELIIGKKMNDINFEIPSLKIIRTALRTFFDVLNPETYQNISVESNEDFSINYASEYPNLVFSINNKNLSYHQLSSGEKVVFILICDIARRLLIANDYSENAIEGEGIVLIDELELHLHPNWQLKIVNALKATFPNVQFIATTHSVKVITSLEQQDVLVLDNGKVYNINQNPLGRDDNSALEEFMDSSKRPVDIENKISEIFNKLAGKNLNYNEIEGDLEKLKSILSTDDPIFVRFNAIIERKKLLEV